MKKYFIILISLLLTTQLFSQNTDIRLLRFINSSQTEPSDHFFKFVSNSNNAIVLGVPITIGIIGLVKHDEDLMRNACVILVAVGINQGITSVLKYTIKRDRPFIKYPDITQKISAVDPSFPSGHTASAFATATSLSLLYAKWYVIAPSFLWAGTVGYSRMDLGVHYPSDVLCGAIIGTGSALLTYQANKWLKKRYAKKHEQYEVGAW